MVPKCRVASVNRIHVRVEVNDFFTAADSAYNVANSVDIAFIEFSHARERCSHRCERLKNLVVH